MSPIVAYHATNPKCRGGITERGLFACWPFAFSNTGRYNRRKRNGNLQPFGVYVYRCDGSLDHPTRGTSPSRCIWGEGPGMDVWRVTYIGPMCPDPLVENALCLLESVPREHVTFITHITGEKG